MITAASAAMRFAFLASWSAFADVSLAVWAMRLPFFAILFALRAMTIAMTAVTAPAIPTMPPMIPTTTSRTPSSVPHDVSPSLETDTAKRRRRGRVRRRDGWSADCGRCVSPTEGLLTSNLLDFCRSIKQFCEDGDMSHPGVEPSEPPRTQTFEMKPDLRWPDDTGADAQAVNQVIVAWDQNNQDLLYLYLGHVGPPPWLTKAAAEERLSETQNTIPVVPKGAFVLGRARAEELWTILGRHLGKLPQ